MKQFVLFVFLLGSVLSGHAQVILNELYTDPANSGSEFFELYNTAPTSVDIGCYTLVTPIRKGNGNGKVSGFYVLTFPGGSTIGPRSYFVGAAASSFKLTSSGPSFTADLNWNNLKGGAFKEYTLDKVRGKEVYSISAAPTNLKDFLTGAYEFYLFDNNGKYINGFMGSAKKPDAPKDITDALSPMNISGSGCSSSIDWSTVTTAEYFDGGNNKGNNAFIGFSREGAGGLCGYWTTTNTISDMTPGDQNPVSTNTNNSGSIAASATFYCGAVNYSISDVNDNSVYPISVELYYDKNNNGKLDQGDTKQKTSPDITSSTYTNKFDNIPANQKVILLFRTNLGCIGKAVALTAATGSLTTSNTSLKCNKSVSFTLEGITDSAETSYSFLFPIMAQLYFNGKAVDGTSTTINSFSTKSLTITGYTIPDNTIDPEIRFTTPVSCFNKTVKLNNTSADITVGGIINCTVNPDTKTRTATYFIVPKASDAIAFPLTLTLYEDANKDASITGDAILGQFHIPGPTSNTFSADLKNPDSYTIITAVSDLKGCASAFEPISNTCSVLPVKFASFSAARTQNNKGVVNLKWQTASEQNNRGFNVQRLYNGEWKTIAFVFSQASNGNSTSLLSYEYRDANSERGLTQYRIQQVDLDDRASFSEVRSVMGLEQAASMIVFPNPSNTGKVTLLFNAPGVRDVIVSDVAGRVIQQFHSVSGTSLEITHLPAGMFAIKMIDHNSGATAVEKVIIQPPY